MVDLKYVIKLPIALKMHTMLLPPLSILDPINPTTDNKLTQGDARYFEQTNECIAYIHTTLDEARITSNVEDPQTKLATGVG